MLFDFYAATDVIHEKYIFTSVKFVNNINLFYSKLLFCSLFLLKLSDSRLREVLCSVVKEPPLL